MTAVGALVRLITILIVVAALPCRAEDVISGRWEGTAQSPDDELTVVVDLAQENGAWVGSIIIPGLGLKGAPLANIKVQPPDVNFAVKCALGIQLKLRLGSMCPFFIIPTGVKGRSWPMISKFASAEFTHRHSS
jgi:hypothetical protein